MLWSRRLAITICPLSNSLKTLCLPIFPADVLVDVLNTSTLRTKLHLLLNKSYPLTVAMMNIISAIYFNCHCSYCYTWCIFRVPTINILIMSNGNFSIVDSLMCMYVFILFFILLSSLMYNNATYVQNNKQWNISNNWYRVQTEVFASKT